MAADEEAGFTALKFASGAGIVAAGIASDVGQVDAEVVHTEFEIFGDTGADFRAIDIAEDGYMRQSFPDGKVYVRRQDIPAIYRINGALYLWRRDYLATSEAPCYFEMPHAMLEIPESRVIDIDTPYDFRLAELILKEGMIQLPWL